MKPSALTLSGIAVALPSRVSSEISTKPFQGQLQERWNRITCLRLPMVMVLALALLLLAAALPRPAVAAPGSWNLTIPLKWGRCSHTATLLPNGHVLVAGGACDPYGAQSTAEIYNPFIEYLQGSTWQYAYPMPEARAGHTAILDLNNINIWVLGGTRETHISPGVFAGTYDDLVFPVRFYTPYFDTWSSIGPAMRKGRAYFTSTWVNAKLFSNIYPYVMSVGGVTVEDYYYVQTGTTEFCDGINTWYGPPPLSGVRAYHTATLLPNGRVLVVGGDVFHNIYAEIFDPIAMTWKPTGPMHQLRKGHTATLLQNGKVLVVGGGTDNSGELYDPAADSWTLTFSIQKRAYHTATLLRNGRVLVAGGYAGDDMSSAEIYDPATGAWLPTGSLNVKRSRHTATLLPNGKVLVVGGGLWYGLNSAELYEPEPAKGKIGSILGLLLN